MKRILILGGTTEAYHLAELAAQIPDCQVTTALAGRTHAPKLPAGELRIGRFGGIDGLAEYLKAYGITQLVDATHPFATEISRNAAIAAAQSCVPYLRLIRPAWERLPDDHWLEVSSLEEAVTVVPQVGQRVFLSVGRQELSHFTNLKSVWFLMRIVDSPDPDQLYPTGIQITQRGPFSLIDERTLLQHYGIEALVSKNSGGAATYAKIEAARELGLPVIMVQRTQPEPNSWVTSVEAALKWIKSRP